MNFSRHFYAIAAIAAVLTATSFGTGRAGARFSPTQNVMVTNTASQPVPTSAQGTTTVGGTVSVGNFPSTQAISGSVGISGTPSVDINSLPAVQVSNFPSTQSVSVSGTPSVNVANSVPIPVQDVARAAQSPLDQIHSLTFPSGQVGGGDGIYMVPGGKRLVVQRFFVEALIGTGETLSAAHLVREFVNPTTFPVYMQHQGIDFNSTEHYVGTIEGPFYFDAGSRVSGDYMKTDNGHNTVMTWTFTGYLENAS